MVEEYVAEWAELRNEAIINKDNYRDSDQVIEERSKYLSEWEAQAVMDQAYLAELLFRRKQEESLKRRLRYASNKN